MTTPTNIRPDQLPAVVIQVGQQFHDGPAAPLLTDLAYRKSILWI